MATSPESSDKSSVSLHVSIGYSRYLIAFLIIIHSLALIAGIANSLAWWVKLSTAAAVSVSLCGSLFRYGLFRPKPLIHIRYIEGDGWTLGFGNQEPRHVSISGSSVVTPWVTILHFKAQDEIIAVIVVRDSLQAEDYRRLRVNVRTHSDR